MAYFRFPARGLFRKLNSSGRVLLTCRSAPRHRNVLYPSANTTISNESGVSSSHAYMSAECSGSDRRWRCTDRVPLVFAIELDDRISDDPCRGGTPNRMRTVLLSEPSKTISNGTLFSSDRSALTETCRSPVKWRVPSLASS